MRVLATVITAASCMAMATFVSACTFFSGVEELELRSTTDPSSPDAGPDSGAGSSGKSPSKDATSPFGQGQDAGSTSSSGTVGQPALPGPLVCGALGTWTSCELADTLATCAQRCQAKGLACVDNCCAYDSIGDYAAKVGMVYATPGLTCDLSSVPSSSSAGFCTDPVLPVGAGIMDVRCCCR
jgi:hypothetical protein